MVEVKSDPPPSKVITKRDNTPLIPLTTNQTESVVEGFLSKGATFFHWERFRELTKDLPPDTRIANIFESLRKTKK